MKLPGLVIAAIIAGCVVVLGLVGFIAATVNLGVALGGLLVVIVLFIGWLMRENDRQNPRKAADALPQLPLRYPDAEAQPAISDYTSAPEYPGGQ